jgi:hypothetical protein
MGWLNQLLLVLESAVWAAAAAILLLRSVLRSLSTDFHLSY